MTADISGKAHVSFLLFLFAGNAHFLGIDNNDEITGINMGGKNSFLFAAEQSRRFHRDLAKDLILRVDDPPLARNVSGFRRKGFHDRGREKARKLRARAGSVKRTCRLAEFDS